MRRLGHVTIALWTRWQGRGEAGRAGRAVRAARAGRAARAKEEQYTGLGDLNNPNTLTARINLLIETLREIGVKQMNKQMSKQTHSASVVCVVFQVVGYWYTPSHT
jgi:hypothetical protein